ncbi:replication initiator, partial [Catellatospora chokoriensis]|uniref:replication initiator n=1 Tax=Catellatospora chokoriensis TaxID=310353 RepID=UPI00357123FC
MTSPTEPIERDPEPARPGSRADRLAMPIAREVLVTIAEHNGVCVRPLAIRRTDLETGRTEVIDVPCGARLASKCKPCAERARKLRR